MSKPGDKLDLEFPELKIKEVDLEPPKPTHDIVHIDSWLKDPSFNPTIKPMVH